MRINGSSSSPGRERQPRCIQIPRQSASTHSRQSMTDADHLGAEPLHAPFWIVKRPPGSSKINLWAIFEAWYKIVSEPLRCELISRAESFIWVVNHSSRCMDGVGCSMVDSWWYPIAPDLSLLFFFSPLAYLIRPIYDTHLYSEQHFEAGYLSFNFRQLAKIFVPLQLAILFKEKPCYGCNFIFIFFFPSCVYLIFSEVRFFYLLERNDRRVQER